MSQLFGDRAVIGNATGCSSIYGGNLPTTPWAKNADGRGPAWNNSLFEDTAEFGLGLRMAIDQKRAYAQYLLTQLSGQLGDELVKELIESPQTSEAEIAAQRQRVATASASDLAEIRSTRRRSSWPTVAESLVKRSVWIVGGDGWAYDIGYGGLDHVLTSGRDVNMLVLDTGVYSNTGGQASKATFRGAVAKFASGGKASRKKDLGMMAVAYGNVYVGASRDGRQSGPDDSHVPRGRIVSGSVADFGLQPLHCPRHQHDDLNDASKRRRAMRLLAALSLRSATRPRRRTSVSSR